MIVAVWTGGRVMTTNWPQRVAPSGMAAAVSSTPAAVFASRSMPDTVSDPAHHDTAATVQRSAREETVSAALISVPARGFDDAIASIEPRLFALSLPPAAPIVRSVPAPIALQQAARVDRWLASGWLLYRGAAGGNALAPNGQLAGSQGGARIWRDFGAVAGSLSAGAGVRVSSALRGPAQRELAPGIGIRLRGRFPFEIIAERRFALEKNGNDRFALISASGFDDFRLPQRVLVSGYAQARIVGLKTRDGFIDGAIRAEREVGSSLRVGVNAWGAAQPGLSRLDVGPSIALRTDALTQPLRVSVEWRQRVAGNARPGSGPAITVGTDF